MPTDFEIRPAELADMPGILSIYNDAVLNTTAIWNEETTSLDERTLWWQERTALGYPVFVAVSADKAKGRVLGYGTFGPFRPHDGYRHSVEQSVYVAESARRNGIASALLTDLEAAAKRQGRHVIIGGLDADNDASMALHKRHGFHEAARLPEVGQKFGRRLTLVLMQKILGP